MMEENTILDGENYRNTNEGMSFKEIVMKQLQRCVSNTSQEMRKGFWIFSHYSPTQPAEKIRYVGDSRKELVRSIDCLHDLLLAKFDTDIKEKSNTLNKEYNDLYEEWINKKANVEDERNYWNNILRIYRNLFQELCLFLERLGWLESSGVEE